MVMVNSGGGGGNYERPAPGMHLAVLAHVYEVGVHDREWKGTKKKATQLALVWELEAQDSKGRPFVMFDVVSASTYGSTNRLKAALEACIRRPLTDSEVDKGFDTSAAVGKCVMLVLVPGKTDPKKVYINRRDMLQDPKRTLAVRGKYGPAHEVPGYVWAVMKSADKGTVPGGQGLEPTKRKGDATTAEPEPQPEGGQEQSDAGDDIPF